MVLRVEHRGCDFYINAIPVHAVSDAPPEKLCEIHDFINSSFVILFFYRRNISFTDFLPHIFTS